MARLLRSQSKISRVRPPVVVGPAVLQRPVQIVLFGRGFLTQYDQARKATWKLRPPVVVNPPVIFLATPTKLFLASRIPATQPQRRPHSKLFPPTVVGPAYQTSPIKITLLNRELPPQYSTARVPHSKLRPPVVVAPVQTVVFSGPTIKLARPLNGATDPKRLPHAKLRAPTVIGPAYVATPTSIKLRDQRTNQVDTRRLTHWKLTPPILTGGTKLVPLGTINGVATVSVTVVRNPRVITPASIAGSSAVSVTLIRKPRALIALTVNGSSAVSMSGFTGILSGLILTPAVNHVLTLPGAGSTALGLGAAASNPLALDPVPAVIDPVVYTTVASENFDSTVGLWQTQTATITWDATHGHRGLGSGKFVSPGATVNEFILYVAPISTTGVYTISIFMQGVAGSAVCLAPTVNSNNPARIQETLTGDWQEITNTITAIAGDTFINVYVTTRNIGAPQALTFYIDELAVKQVLPAAAAGSTVLPLTPAVSH